LVLHHRSNQNGNNVKYSLLLNCKGHAIVILRGLAIVSISYVRGSITKLITTLTTTSQYSFPRGCPPTMVFGLIEMTVPLATADSFMNIENNITSFPT
jgi:hypothetical protein